MRSCEMEGDESLKVPIFYPLLLGQLESSPLEA